jgi:hypothetical protein
MDQLDGGTAARDGDEAPTFIGLGEAGRSGEFNHVATVYVRKTDAQPNCVGCRALRVVYDGYDAGGPVGVPLPNGVRLNLAEACEGGATTAAVRAVPTRDRPFSAVESAPLTLTVSAERCTPDGKVKVELVGDRCINPTVPECRDQVVRETFVTTLGEIQALAPFTGSTFPNRVLVN